VRHHWGQLDAGWQSYARAGVDAQYEETVREIERMGVMLEQLGALGKPPSSQIIHKSGGNKWVT